MTIKQRLEWLKTEEHLSYEKLGWLAGVSPTAANKWRKTGQISRESQIYLKAKLRLNALDWLIEGTGSPFRVIHLYSDSDAAAYFRDELEGDRRIYVIKEGGTCDFCVVAETTVYESSPDRGASKYNDVVVYAGAIGPGAISEITRARSLFYMELKCRDFIAIVSGKTGNWSLVNKVLPLAEPASRQTIMAVFSESLAYAAGLDERQRRILELFEQLGQEDADSFWRLGIRWLNTTK